MTQTFLDKVPLKYVKLIRYGINIDTAGEKPAWALELWRDWYRENVRKGRPWV